MSWEITGRVWHYDFDKVTGWLVMAICDASNDEGRGCIESDERLMWKTKISRATLYRIFSALEEKGIIARTTRSDGCREITIFLDKATLKKSWDEVKPTKRGGARKKSEKSKGLTATRPFEESTSLTMRLKGSHHETQRVSPRDSKGLTVRLKGSHCETENRVIQEAPAQAASGPAQSENAAILLYDPLYDPKPDPERGEDDHYFRDETAWRRVVLSLPLTEKQQDSFLTRCRLERSLEDRADYRIVALDKGALTSASRRLTPLLDALQTWAPGAHLALVDAHGLQIATHNEDGVLALAPDPSPVAAPPSPACEVQPDETTDALDTADSSIYPAPDLWRQARLALTDSGALTHAQRESWLDAAELLGVTAAAGEYILIFKTRTKADMVRLRFADAIRVTLQDLTRQRCELHIWTAPASAKAAAQ